MQSVNRAHLVLLAAVIAVVAWSGWRPHDRLTWWLEVSPGLGGLVLLTITYGRFRLTTLVYVLIALHITVLAIGGHYTYARVPFFDWLRPVFNWHRNHFDRLGHLMQGFVPAMISREVILRLDVLKRRSWLPFIVVSICLAISAVYELIEWCTALVSGAASIDFLGTQGDVWDTQIDMFLAFVSASVALIVLSPVHDRALRKLAAPAR